MTTFTHETNHGTNDGINERPTGVTTYIKINTDKKQIIITRNGASGSPRTKLGMTITGTGLHQAAPGEGDDLRNMDGNTWRLHTWTTTEDDIILYLSLSKIVLTNSNITDVRVIVNGTSKGKVSINSTSINPFSSTIYEKNGEPGPGPGPSKGILQWIKDHIMVVGGIAGGSILLIILLMII